MEFLADSGDTGLNRPGLRSIHSNTLPPVHGFSSMMCGVCAMVYVSGLSSHGVYVTCKCPFHDNRVFKTSHNPCG
jgi:hypothetical protein